MNKKLILFTFFAVSTLLALEIFQVNAALTSPPAIIQIGDDPSTVGNSFAYEINDNSQVVGRQTNDAMDFSYAFIWTARAGKTPLQNLLGTFDSTAYDINLKGQAVGVSSREVELSSGAIVSRPYRAVIWNAKGEVTSLGTLEGYEASIAYGINSNGQVVGVAVNYGPSGIGPFESRAFIWTAASGMKALSTLAGIYTTARDINDNGQVVGSYQIAGDPPGPTHACIWTAQGAMKDLGLSGTSSSAAKINKWGDVIGYRMIDSSVKAFLWTARNGAQDIFPQAEITSFADDINDNGQVVGSYRISGATPSVNYAYVWTAKGGLKTLEPLNGYTNAIAETINNKGQIAGIAYTVDSGFAITNVAVLWKT